MNEYKVTQGCAVGRIEGSPVLGTCEIKGVYNTNMSLGKS